jgi:CheY-like chemotaxis protein
MLAKHGYHMVLAEDGEQALELLRREPFDLVLMDCQMPVMDGFEATAEIRRLEAGTGKRLAIVAMTANVMVGDEQACLDGGMDGYVPKPINRVQLYEVLLRFLGNTGALRDGEPRPPVP